MWASLPLDEVEEDSAEAAEWFGRVEEEEEEEEACALSASGDKEAEGKEDIIRVKGCLSVGDVARRGETDDIPLPDEVLKCMADCDCDCDHSVL